jgi:hypothetical protein
MMDVKDGWYDACCCVLELLCPGLDRSVLISFSVVDTASVFYIAPLTQ